MASAESSQPAQQSSAAASNIRAIVCPGHTRPVHHVCFSEDTEDGTFFISACHDRLPMLRDASNGDWVGTFKGHRGAVWSACVNEDATKAATGGGDSVAKFWDATTGSELRSFDHKHIVKGVALDSGTTRLATACSDKHVRVFDVTDGGSAPPSPVLDVALSGACRSVLWSADDSALLVPAFDKLYKVDVATGSASDGIPLGGEVQDMAWVGPASAGQLCLAAGQHAVFVDTHKMAVTASHKLDYTLESVAAHPSHPQYFLTGGKDHVWVQAHSMEDGSLVTQLDGHHGPVHVVRFTNEGDRFITGSDDSTVRIWSVSSILPE